MWTETRKPVAAILLFDDVEVLDFAGPYDVLKAARRSANDPYFEVFTVAERSEVACTGGLRVIADHALTACPPFDLLIVPGGAGARENRPEIQAAPLQFIQNSAEAVEILASVCTGAFLLGRAGLLEQHRATTHTRRIELFREEFPSVETVKEKIVDLGGLITAGGVSSGIDLSLHIIERWFGVDARREAASVLDGPWQ